VGVAVIHGIGGRDADFADEMVEAVRQVFHRS
jgi:hypothetical protein